MYGAKNPVTFFDTMFKFENYLKHVTFQTTYIFFCVCGQIGNKSMSQFGYKCPIGKFFGQFV